MMVNVRTTSSADREAQIRAACTALADMLVEKNRAYGDSAICPVRVFSRASAEEQLLVRIDDKLSRLARGAAAGEDVVQDLAGYLVLLMVARSAVAPDLAGLAAREAMHDDT